MLRVFRAELLKIHWGLFIGILLIGPVLSTMQGSMDSLTVAGVSPWLRSFMMSTFTYTSIYYPIATAVIVAMICRYEHANGSWKQILSLPVSRTSVYFTKFVLAVFLVGLMQVLFLLFFLGTGMIKGLSGELTWEIYFNSLWQGWIAVFPLLALQLWVSSLWKNFAAPLSMNIALTLPAVLVANSEQIGPWYLWSQPMLAMMPHEKNWFASSPETLYGVIIGSFILFIVAGWRHFLKRDW